MSTQAAAPQVSVGIALLPRSSRALILQSQGVLWKGKNFEKKKRWFQVDADQHRWNYFVKQGGELKGFIDLTKVSKQAPSLRPDASIAQLAAPHNAQVTEVKLVKGKNFIVRTDRVYDLQAETPEVALRWIE